MAKLNGAPPIPKMPSPPPGMAMKKAKVKVKATFKPKGMC